MDEGLLITLVESHSCLYNKQSADFKNIRKKDNAWAEIACAMNQTEEDCQRVWNNIRTRYARELKKCKIEHSGMESREEVSWPLFYHLAFLERYIKPRRTLSNVTPKNKATTTAPRSSTPWRDRGTPSPSSSWNSLSQITNSSATEDDNSSYTESGPEDTGAACTSAETVVTPTTAMSTGSRAMPGTSHQPPSKKKRCTNSSLEDKLSATADSLSAFLMKQNADDSDKAFAEYVCATLKGLNKTAKNKAKMEILSILSTYDVE